MRLSSGSCSSRARASRPLTSRLLRGVREGVDCPPKRGFGQRLRGVRRTVSRPFRLPGQQNATQAGGGEGKRRAAEHARSPPRIVMHCDAAAADGGEQQPTKKARRGWTEEEEQQIRAVLTEGKVDLVARANQLGRTVGSVKVRMGRLKETGDWRFSAPSCSSTL